LSRRILIPVQWVEIAIRDQALLYCLYAEHEALIDDKRWILLGINSLGMKPLPSRKPWPASKHQQKIERMRKLPKTKQKLVLDLLDTVLQSAPAQRHVAARSTSATLTPSCGGPLSLETLRFPKPPQGLGLETKRSRKRRAVLG